MNHSPNKVSKKPSESQKQQKSPSETKVNISEIEKLYLQIKEDWL